MGEKVGEQQPQGNPELTEKYRVAKSKPVRCLAGKNSQKKREKTVKGNENADDKTVGAEFNRV